MPKATIEFLLPEEQSEFEKASNVYRYTSVISEMAGWIRGLYKWSDEESVTVDELREKFYKILEDNEVDPYD